MYGIIINSQSDNILLTKLGNIHMFSVEGEA